MIDPAMLKKALMEIKGVAREMKGEGLKKKYFPEPEPEMPEEEAAPMEGEEPALEMDAEADGGEMGEMPEMDEDSIKKIVEMLCAAK